MKQIIRPIIYIRGYAFSQGEIEDTVATPYMGFNLGATKVRQLWNRDIVQHVFESPLIRLLKDHAYSDVYNDGDELTTGRRVSAKSVWIYRYYEAASKDLGSGERPPMEDYARGLHEVIEKVRDAVCGPASSTSANVQKARAAFKVHLVAHSMGGLIARSYIQNVFPNEIAVNQAEKDKGPPIARVFTYATPHGGIDLRAIGNIPSFLRFNNVDNFNEERMRQYLALGDSGNVNSLNNKFDSERFFSLIGTNYQDYSVAGGAASAAVGPMSDGLVQIKNAYAHGTPRAFVHRSHSGHYGIVNSEEGYQNLRRFLFGEFQVDVSLHIGEISLPAAVQKAKDKGHEVRASYHVESITRVRGARWDLNRRMVSEASASFVSQDRIDNKLPVRLFTGYLLKAAMMPRKRSLGFSIELGVLVPEYQVDKKWRLDDHYDGGYIFRDKLNLELDLKSNGLKLKYGWDSDTPNDATEQLVSNDQAGGAEYRIPVVRASKPGITSELVIVARPRDAA